MLVAMHYCRLSSWRQIATELALLALVVYATVVPWHATARTLQIGFGQEFAQAFCHGSSLDGLNVAAADVPAGTDCPICKGVAALAFALAPTTDPAVAPSTGHSAWNASVIGAKVPATGDAPRNRGPPSLL